MPLGQRCDRACQSTLEMQCIKVLLQCLADQSRRPPNLYFFQIALVGSKYPTLVVVPPCVKLYAREAQL